MSYGDYSSPKSHLFNYYLDLEESSSPSKDLSETDIAHSAGFQNDTFKPESSSISSPVNPNSSEYPTLNQASLEASISIQHSISNQWAGEFRPLYAENSNFILENTLDPKVSSLSVRMHISGGMTPPQHTHAHPSQPTMIPQTNPIRLFPEPEIANRMDRLHPADSLNSPQNLTSSSTTQFTLNFPQFAPSQVYPSQTMTPHTITINNSPSPESRSPMPELAHRIDRLHPADPLNSPQNLTSSSTTQFTLNSPQFAPPQVYPTPATMSPHTITINKSPSPEGTSPMPELAHRIDRLHPVVTLNTPQNLINSSPTQFTLNFSQFATPQVYPTPATMSPHTITINKSPSPKPELANGMYTHQTADPLNTQPTLNSFSTQFRINLPPFVQPQQYPSQATMSPHTITINNNLYPQSELTQRLDTYPQTDSLNPQSKTSSYSTQFTINFPPPMPPAAAHQLSPLQQMMNLPKESINPAFNLELKKLANPLPSPPMKASLAKTSYPKKNEAKFVMYNPEKNYRSKNLPPNASPRRAEKLRTPAESKALESTSEIDLTTILKPCEICKTDSFTKKCRIKISDLNKNPICMRCQEVASNIIAKLADGNDIYKNVPRPNIELYNTVYEYLVKKNMIDKNNPD